MSNTDSNGAKDGRRTSQEGPYEVKVTLWHQGDGERQERVVDGFYDEDSPIDCVNALLYDLRGKKSAWELAYVNEIKPAEDSDDE